MEEEVANDKILVIEDDRDIRDGIRLLLEDEQYEVQEAESAEEGLALLTPETDLIILDIMLPKMSGLTACEEIRKTSYAPILFLTARTRESDKLAGFLAGGDDYLTKPFSFSELLGRVSALLRRYKVYHGKPEENAETNGNDYITCSGLRLNRRFRELYVNKKRVDLSETEYRLLLLLMEHPGQVFSAREIYETVWKEPYFATNSNTVMVHIRKLRLKTEKDANNPTRILTLWGKGYTFKASDD